MPGSHEAGAFRDDKVSRMTSFREIPLESKTKSPVIPLYAKQSKRNGRVQNVRGPSLMMAVSDGLVPGNRGLQN